MSDDENKPDALPPATLELHKTLLRIEEGELVRRTATGGVTTRIPLDDVESIRFVRQFNMNVLFAFAFAAGLTALGRFASEYNVLTVLLYVVALFVGLFGLMAVRIDRIVVRSRGEEFSVDCADTADECAGFVVSVRPMCGGR